MDLRILEIASNTENNKILDNHTHKSKNKNHICGDEMEISLVVKNNKVVDMGYQCKSCVYCQASVSLLSQNIKNKSLDEIKDFINICENIFENTKVMLEKKWTNFKELFDKKKMYHGKNAYSSYENCIKSIKIVMIKINKEIFKKALLAGIFSAFTIGVLTVLTYKSALGLFLAGSFGSSMVLLFGFPESPFAQPKNVFFGHLVTALVGVIFVSLIPFQFILILQLAVGVGIFFMILLNVVHPPAGGNPIMVIIGSVSYDYLIFPNFWMFNNYFIGNFNK